MTSAPPQVMLIDDDRSVLEMVEEALKSHGMIVHAFNDGRRALGLLGVVISLILVSALA